MKNNKLYNQLLPLGDSGHASKSIHKNNHEKRLDCDISLIPIESLKKYYKPEEINGHCKNCPGYSTNWSCPPHDFKVTDYIGRYSMAYAIGVKVSLSGFSKKGEAMDYYYSCRHSINRRLIEHEGNIPDSVVLLAGQCDLCDTCTMQSSLECNYPEKQRHSLESLGFKVSGIIEDFFGDTLQLNKAEMPESLYIVSGILSNIKLDTGEVRKVVTDDLA